MTQTAETIVLRGGEFLQTQGRDIDQALFAHHFGGAPVELVLDALARYQNPDGGFYGLEVDIAAPQSNPFATEIALVILRWSRVNTEHPLVQRAVAYLENTQEPNGDWRFTPEIYQHALPPWFQHWQWPNLNPAITIAGVLRQIGAGSAVLHNRAQQMFTEMASPADFGNEFYSVRPYAYFLQAPIDHPLADLYRWGVVWWILRKQSDPDLDAYHLLEFAPSPQSEIARRLPPSAKDSLLDALLQQQQADGGWPTPYDTRWRAWVTITSLLTLRAYGRI